MSDAFEFEVPMTTQSPNVEEYRLVRAARRKKERGAITLCWRSARVQQRVPEFPVVVTLTRIAPSLLDAHENLPMALKAPVDAVTACLGLKNDRTPMVEWRYAQRARGVREYAVHVRVESAGKAVGPRCSKCGGEMVSREAYAVLEARLAELEARR